MSVRAKFKVTGKTDQAGGGTVVLGPVTSGSPENESFYHYTPGGNIMLSTINAAAYDQFEIGKEYYVDFTSADAPIGEAPSLTPGENLP